MTGCVRAMCLLFSGCCDGLCDSPVFVLRRLRLCDSLVFVSLRLLTVFGLCLDTAVAQAPDCGVMRGHVLQQVEVVREFLDYKQPEKGTGVY